jgi:UDP-glucose 4-epimerase
MKIFLTGGTGFIGKNIQEQLGHAYTILAPSHDELDLTDSEAVYEYLEKNPVDVVIHCANIGGTRKQQHVFGITHTNLKIFFNIVRAKPFYKRLINLGSGAEYGKQFPIIKAKEEFFDTHVPSDEYGLYKYVTAKYAAKVDFITHFRLFAVFGKYEDFEIRFISNAICKALFNLPITMRQNVKFDYLFIDDFIQILDKCIQQPPRETFINAGRGESLDLKTIAEKVIKEVGNNVEILISNTGWGNEYTCDNTRLKSEIKGLTFTPIDLAIAKLAAYYKTILPNLNQQAFARDI